MAAKVGFDLYMRMLKKSIRQLLGLDLPVVPRTNVLLPTDGTPDTFSLPATYMSDMSVRRNEEAKARLAENTASLVNLTNSWKDAYGPLPAKVQRKLKTLHLHACTRRLGIDLVGALPLDRVENRYVCILRSPGLRPRHLATISQALPRGALPKGIDVCFPARLSLTGKDMEVIGGQKIDSRLLVSESTGEDDDDNWDSLDQEDIEAMEEISSASSVKEIADIDYKRQPFFRIRDFGKPDGKKAVDLMLKFLLPLSKIVIEKQENEAEKAKARADLRERTDVMRRRQSANEALEAQRMGYRY